MIGEPIVIDEDFRSEEVKAFWDYMTSRYRSTVVDKRSSGKMIALGGVLDALGVLDARDFLESFTTTLRRTVFVPFEVGRLEAPFDGLEQVILCIHEHTHVAQYEGAGWKYELRYLVDSAARALYEAEAYRTTQIVETWRFGAPRTSPAALAAHLESYGCTADDITVARRYLELSAPSIAAGAIMGEVAQAGIAWLNVHVPRLRARRSPRP